MKIAVLTYFIGQNYGATLQAYATMTALRRLGHQVEFIHYHQPWSKGPSFWSPRSYLAPSPGRTIRKLARMARHHRARHYFGEMEKLFPTTPIYYGSDLGAIERDPPEADAYLAGSDQVWNCSAGFSANKAYFLPFGDDSVRRVSYGSSLGGYEFPPEHVGEIVALLSRFDAVSVRERQSAAYLTEIGIPVVESVPDPTILLEPTDYESITARYGEESSEGFSYILHEQGQQIESQVFACLNDCRTITNVALDKFRMTGAQNRLLSVPEFLTAIANAKVVATNSFHCVVFSVLFHRNFIVIPLEGKLEKMNMRILSFLSAIGLEDRVLCSGKLLQHIKPIGDTDWMAVDRKLEEMRKIGLEYLRNSLGPPRHPGDA